MFFVWRDFLGFISALKESDREMTIFKARLGWSPFIFSLVVEVSPKMEGQCSP